MKNDDIVTQEPPGTEATTDDPGGWVEFGALAPADQARARADMEKEIDQEGQGGLLPREEQVTTALAEYLFQPIDDRVWRKLKAHIVEAAARNGGGKPEPKIKGRKGKKEAASGGTPPTHTRVLEAGPAQTAVIEMLDHGRIAPWANPREHFDEGRIEELRASMRERGFDPAFPLVVRICAPSLNSGDDKDITYEIACGERRWRAAGLEKIGRIPCIVRELTDRQMLEIALVENIQRDGLTPLEEARGYRRLLELKDEKGNPVHTVESAARIVGKKENALRQYLSLLKLKGGLAEKALEEGRFGLSHGRLLAALPSPALRDQLTKEVLNPRYGGGAMPVKELASKISLEYNVALREAKFDRADETLVPVATDENGDRLKGGACGDCPWNSKNKGEADTRNHLCTNPECFREKTAAAHNVWAAKMTDPEKKIRALNYEENAEVFNPNSISRHPWLAFGTPYVFLTSEPDFRFLKDGSGAKNVKKWKQLIKGRGVETVLARTEKGDVVELADRELALAAARENDKALPKGERIFKDPDEKGTESLSTEVIERIQGAFDRENEHAAGATARVALVNAARKTELGDALLRLANETLLQTLADNDETALYPIAERAGYKFNADLDQGDDFAHFLKHARGLAGADLKALFVDAVCEFEDVGNVAVKDDEWAKALKVDLKKVKQAANAEAAARRRQFKKLLKCDYVTQMENAKDAEEGREIIEAHANHVHDLQVFFGLQPTVGDVSARTTVGFSVVKDKEWAAAFAAAAQKSRACEALLQTLVKQRKGYVEAWERLLKKEREKDSGFRVQGSDGKGAPEKRKPGSKLSAAERAQIASALKARWAAKGKKKGGAK